MKGLNRIPISFLICGILVGTVCDAFGSDSSALQKAPRPNFLIIVADDMGFSDLGCYGGEISTPHLDSLAMTGLRYTQFYNASRCWPTRASVLTGYYPQQIRRDTAPGADLRKFGVFGKRPDWAPLLAQRLQPLGYRSYHSGKWHVDGAPLENGFEHSFHVRLGENNYFKAEGNTVDGQPDTQMDNYYATTRIVDHAIACLQEHARKHASQPFFHLLAFTAPHFPLHALPEDIERYRDLYLTGWDQLREERHQRVKALGIANTELSSLEPNVGPPYDFPESLEVLGPLEVNRPVDWASLSAEQQEFQATKMAIHAAMVDRMDREIGRLLDQLRLMGNYEDTLILFLSDNGASAEIMVRGDGHDPEAHMGSAVSYLCLGPGFSSASNTPFRRHKSWVHEGGISTPLIVHWPAGIHSMNELRTVPAHVIDIAPTILELAGAAQFSEPDAPSLPGHSLVPTFSEEVPSLHETIWFYHEGNRALRSGDWKILHAGGPRTHPWPISEAAKNELSLKPDWQLYNMATDRSEEHDLADEDPDRVKRMAEVWFSMTDQILEDASR